MEDKSASIQAAAAAVAAEADNTARPFRLAASHFSSSLHLPFFARSAYRSLTTDNGDMQGTPTSAFDLSSRLNSCHLHAVQC